MLELNFDPFPDLETERLLLRKMEAADATKLFFLRSDATVLKYLGREPAKTLKEVEDFIDTINGNIANNVSILWAIALKQKPEELIGTICLWNIQNHNYRAEIGYVLHPDHWRKGLMKEAILEVVEYGFKSMKLHSIEARLHADNDASAGALESTGFIKEGYFKEDAFFNGEFHDSLIYSRLQTRLSG